MTQLLGKDAVWYDVNVYSLTEVTVDHADVSPVALGTAPANSYAQLYVKCTENEAGATITLGWAADTDGFATDADMPILTTQDALITKAIYVDASTALQATISGAGTAGKWKIFAIIISGD